jgi:hypothetical protein
MGAPARAPSPSRSASSVQVGRRPRRDKGPLAPARAGLRFSRMTWETPEITEIRMDAEIGAYQGDEGDTIPAPAAADETDRPPG